jgi:hypothetical protein
MSPLGRVFRAFIEEAGREEHIPHYIAALRKEIVSDPSGFMRDLWTRTPKDVQVAVLATILSPDEKAGLVKRFDLGSGDDHAVDLVHRALTRAVEGVDAQPPSRG